MSSAPLPSLANPASGLLHSYGSLGAPAAGCPLRRRPLSGMFPLSFLCTTSLLAETPPWGFFRGAPKFESCEGGRKLRLLEDFSYTDPQATTWMVPEKTIVGETAIPSAFAPFVSGAARTKLRRAAIIHDVACTQMTAAWADVHLTYYHAMRCAGVDEIAAKILFYAAHHFGPRWGVVTALAEIFSAVGLSNENLRPFVSPRSAAEVSAWIEKTNPSIETLRKTTPVAAKFQTALSA